MRISCGTTWAETLPLHEVAKLVSQAGYEAIDLVLSAGIDSESLHGAVKGTSLTPASLTVQAGTDEFEGVDVARIVASAEMARSLGLSSVTIVAGDRRQRSVAAWAEQVGRILDAVRDLEIELINHCGSRLEQLEDFRELLIHVPDPRLRAAVDVLEFHRASVDPRGALDELADRMVRLVLADAVGERQVPLGDGEINVASVISHAQRAHELRWVSVSPLATSHGSAVDDLAAERRRLASLLDAD